MRHDKKCLNYQFMLKVPNIVSLACWVAAFCLFMGLAQAQHKPVSAKDYKNVQSLTEDLSKTLKNISKYEQNIASLKYPLLNAQAELDRHDKAIAQVVHNERVLQGKINSTRSYLFVLGLSEQCKTKSSQLRERFLAPLKKDEDLIKMVSGGKNTNQELADSIVFLESWINYLDELGVAAQKVIPSLKPPAFIPEGANPEDFLKQQLSLLDDVKKKVVSRREGWNESYAVLKRLNNHFRKQLAGLQSTRTRYYELLRILDQSYLPPYLKSVIVYASDDSRKSERRYYHAIYRDENREEIEKIDQQIAILQQTIPELERGAKDAEKYFFRQEEAFVALVKKWQEHNDDYYWMYMFEAYLNMQLEFLDSFISVASDGFNPASIIFEGAYRTFEWTTGDPTDYPEPLIHKDIAQARRSLSKQLRHPDEPKRNKGPKADLKHLMERTDHYIGTATAYESYLCRMKDHAGDQLGEAIKVSVGTVTTGGLKKLSEYLIGKQIKKDAIKGQKGSVKALYYAAAFHPDIDLKTWKKMGIEEHLFNGKPRPLPNRFNRISRIFRGEVAEPSKHFVTRVKKKISAKAKAKGLVKDFFISAAITYGKDFIKGFSEDKRAEMLTEMAFIDIEWLLKRHDYQMAGKVWRDHLKGISRIQATIGQLIEDKHKLGSKRKREVLISKPFSTRESLVIKLEFSDSVYGTTLKIDDVTLESRVQSREVSFVLKNASLVPGLGILSVAASKRRPGENVSIDSSPESPAYFAISADGSGGKAGSWRDYDKGQDQTHQIKVEAATLEIVDPKIHGYLAGDYVDLKYTLPGSLAHQNTRVALEVKPHETAKVKGVQSGVAKFRLSASPGEHKLILVNEANLKVAETPVRIVMALEKVWAGKWDLNDHGNPPLYLLQLRQTENRVSGNFSRVQEKGTLSGIITENQLVGTWKCVFQGKRQFGSFKFIMESNGQKISGSYIHEEEESKKKYPGVRTWSAVRRGQVSWSASQLLTKSLRVDSKANIFGAGRTDVPPAADNSGGLLPPVVHLPPSKGRFITFPNVGGAVSCCGGQKRYFNGPEGGTIYKPTNITSYRGISGIVHKDKTMFLAGVFLDDTIPNEPAPSRLEFSNATDLSEFSPGIRQVFYIGNGTAGVGGGQITRFVVPEGATRLFLGFADSAGFSGSPSAYTDNVGSLTVEIVVHGQKKGTGHSCLKTGGARVIITSHRVGGKVSRVTRITGTFNNISVDMDIWAYSWAPRANAYWFWPVSKNSASSGTWEATGGFGREGTADIGYEYKMGVILLNRRASERLRANRSRLGSLPDGAEIMHEIKVTRVGE